MDKKFNEDINKENYDIDGLLDFLDEDSTYFVVDNETGVVGNKKTGVMLDKRTGKVFSESSKLNYNNIKYDFLDYKKSVDVLNNLDNYKKDFLNEDNEDIKVSIDDKQFKAKSYLGKNLITSNLRKKFINSRKKESLNNNSDKFIDYKQSEFIPEKNSVNQKFENENKVSSEELISNLGNKSDEEILEKINQKFNVIEPKFSEANSEKVINTNKYDFSSFDAYEQDQKKNVEENSALELQKYDQEKNDLSKFKMIMDFEEYLYNVPDDEIILKSPFDNDEVNEMPKVVIEKNNKDDSFSPFDELNSFEVEEIQSYDMDSEQGITNDGIIPDLNLNQGISRKVSIREVIKNKQKKKQEQKEIQEKLFFETLDERIEQFKNFKEHSIDSQEILNAINMDLTRINSSIRVEFEGLNKKRKMPSKTHNNNIRKDDKFSLQNLLEEIYEESGEKPSSLDVNELDIESIKKDLAKKENNKNIVN